MFYLKEALKLKPFSLIVFLLWFLSTIAMVGTLGHGKLISQYMNQSPAQTISLPYFYALIDSDRPYERAMRKLRELPGVNLVSAVAQNDLEKSLEATLSGAGLSLSDLLSGPTVAGIKIVFEQGLAEQGQKLIRDYLLRLVGETYITMGPVATPDPDLYSAQSGPLNYKEYLPWAALAVFTLIWLWSWGHLLRAFKLRAFLIENYQRRTGVLPKMIVSVAAPFILFAFLINAWFAPLEITVLVALLIFGVAMSFSLWRGGQWEVA